MYDLAVVIALIASLLVVISFTQPLAERLRLPYSVLLAVIGVALGGLCSFLLYTPLTDAFNDIVAPVVNLPFGAAVFLDVFLPLLLFHAALTVDVRELVEDWAPILTLAVVAVFVAAAGIGAALSYLGGVPLVVALLVGSIVATTDPAAVVGIFRDLGAPLRLTRLVEGESLLNDAAAIVLFAALLDRLTTGREPDLASTAEHVALAFGGGVALGFAGGRAFGAMVPLLRGSKLAEVTLSLALPYLTYLAGDLLLDVSGVVAVVSAGLTAGAVGRSRLERENWRYLQELWEQIGFWAGSLIFVCASLLVPKLMAGAHLRDLWLLGLLVLAALATRAAVLFALLPLLSVLRLSQKVGTAYQLVITWGGLRGAVTLALALAVTENQSVDAPTQSLVAVLATGFVLFTLLVNGLTLQPMIRLLKLDRLSPLNQLLRSKVVTLSLAEVRDAIQETAKNFEIGPGPTNDAVDTLELRLDSERPDIDPETLVSERDRITVGLVALTNYERRIIRDHQAQHTVSAASIERLLRNTNLILDAAKAEGRIGYNRAAQRLLVFSRGFRLAHFLHRWLGIEQPLRRAVSSRFETSLVRAFALKDVRRFNERRIGRLLGPRIARILDEVIDRRLTATTRALDALRLQYPEHAEALERQFLHQTGLRLELAWMRELHEEGLIGGELFQALDLEQTRARRVARAGLSLDLGLRTEDLIRRFGMSDAVEPGDFAALTRMLRPRLAVPDEKIVEKGQRGNHVYFISSGAVEVVLPTETVRLGRGDFFGEMALLGRRRRSADVVALGYCQLLMMSAADFRRFLADHPLARERVERVVEERLRHNEQALRAQAGSAG